MEPPFFLSVVCDLLVIFDRLVVSYIASIYHTRVWCIPTKLLYSTSPRLIPQAANPTKNRKLHTHSLKEGLGTSYYLKVRS